LDGVINRAGRKLLEDVDPAETKRIVELNNVLYDQVYDYQLPTDVKGDRIIDIRPQVNRILQDRFFQTYNEEFDLYKDRVFHMGSFSVNWNTAVKSIRISKNFIAGLLVNSASTITGNGTWATGSNAFNLQQDDVNFVADSSSLRFDISAGAPGSTGFLENSTMEPVDISRDFEQGAEFIYVFLPDPLIVTNCNLRWGSSAADYYERTVTTTQDSLAFQRGWNLLRFDWNGATVVGAPDPTAINYARITITYDGTAQFNYRINNLVSRLGSIYQIEYYSKFLFRDFITGAFQENVTDDSNLINLDTDSYNLLFNLTAFYSAQQIQGSNSAFDSQYWMNEYLAAKSRYTAKYKSEIIQPAQPYYKMPRKPSVFIRYP
jgi:hypothetical protein